MSGGRGEVLGGGGEVVMSLRKHLRHCPGRIESELGPEQLWKTASKQSDDTTRVRKVNASR